VGQFLVAASETLPSAVVGRIFVGIGDACTFISMMRLSNSWFTGKLASQLQQWLATIGQLGQILSAIPFALLLHTAGWSTAFAGAAAVSIFVAVLVWIMAKENPVTTSESTPIPMVLSNLQKNLRVPTTWLAFFTHFSTQSTGTSFALLWGVPFMVSGVGLERSVAGGFLTVFVVTNAAMGPFIGWFCGRFPQFRQRFVFILVTTILVTWFVLVLTPGPSPLWLLAALVIVIGVGGQPP
jgi:MFS family permease